MTTLTDKQKKLDKNKNGILDKKDIDMLRASKKNKKPKQKTILT